MPESPHKDMSTEDKIDALIKAVDSLDTDIQLIKNVLEGLRVHSHDGNGRVVVPL